MSSPSLPTLAAEQAAARACRLCAATLPWEPRPVLRGEATARLLIVGQAPGRKVHETGIPWNDASGTRLRAWLGMSPAVFYDERQVAIMPMGLCYPGAAPRGGDYPPRPECAPLWHSRLRPLLPAVRLTLLVGSYAQKYYLGSRCRSTLSETVLAAQDYLPAFWPLPHPSWRNTAWLNRRPAFTDTQIPALQAHLRALGIGPLLPTTTA